MQIKKFEKKWVVLFSLQITLTYRDPGKNYTHAYIFALGIVPVSSVKQLILCKVKHVYKLS